MIKKILIRPDPLLKKPATDVTVFDADLHQLAQDMWDTMYANEGCGLAANQIGDPRNIFVMDVGSGPEVYVNAKITAHSGELFLEEGCLSLPWVSAPTKRFEGIELNYQDLQGNQKTMSVPGGLLSRCIQHETDHLKGLLYIDHSSLYRSLWNG